MSAEIAYLINLHKEGKIDDNALNKALNTLQPASTQPKSDVKKEPLDATFAEKVRERRRRKKKARKQRQKEAKGNKTEEPKRELEEEPEEELRLVDKPPCNYFKAYEINAEKYKDPVILFDDKKSVFIEQVKKDIQEYNSVKFSIGLS